MMMRRDAILGHILAQSGRKNNNKTLRLSINYNHNVVMILNRIFLLAAVSTFLVGAFTSIYRYVSVCSTRACNFAVLRNNLFEMKTWPS